MSLVRHGGARQGRVCVPKLTTEIAQGRPFSSMAEETFLNLVRSADCLQRAMQRKVRSWGVTSTQYNVLRILRGAHPEGLTCSAIGDRMLTAEPDITRLLGRLKSLKLIRQQRDTHDRRVIWTHISAPGQALLAEMDPVVREFPRQMLGHLDEDQMSTLITLLEAVRQNCQDRPSPVTCDGVGGSKPCPIERQAEAGNGKAGRGA